MKSKVKKTKKGGRQGGFTLVEIAIVMVIIGILLGAVLKGQSMIENAKIKAVTDQARSLVAAVISYQDKFGQLPGDDNAATTHLANTGCSSIGNGNNDGYIQEWYYAHRHLACGGFITGSYNNSQPMRHKFNADVYIVPNGWGVNLPSTYRNMVRFDNLAGSVAMAVDTALDDGVWNTGSVRGNVAYTNATVSYLGVGI